MQEPWADVSVDREPKPIDLGNEHDNKQLPRHDKDRKKRGGRGDVRETRCS